MRLDVIITVLCLTRRKAAFLSCLGCLFIAGLILALASPAHVNSSFGVRNFTKSSNEPSLHTNDSIQAAYLNLPLSFEANQGQTDPQVAFLSRGTGYTLFLSDSEHLKKVKTLLVDDDELVRDSLRMVFDTKGCFIKVAETAEEGLQALEDEKYDIIISDLRLPGIDGLRFLKFASMIQLEPVKLLITAYKDDHILTEALRIGVNEFIQKPFSVDSFLELLALTLKKEGEKVKLP